MRKLVVLLSILIISILIITGCSSPATTPTTAGTTAAPSTTTAPWPEKTVVNLAHVDVPNPKGLPSITVDAMLIDQETHLLYVTALNAPGIEVLDISKPTATFVKEITLESGSPVPEIVKDLKKMFAPLVNGKVAVIDINPTSSTFNTVIDTFDTGTKPLDGAAYIPGVNKLYCVNNNEGTLAVIDLSTNKVIKTIKDLGTDLEPAQYNPDDKMVYIPNQETNVIYKFDPKTDTQISKTDIVDPLYPSHFGIKPGSDIAVLGGVNPTNEHIVTWDFKTNKVASVINKVGQCDFVIYSPVVDLFFTASSKFSGGDCIAILDGNGKFLTNVLTGANGGHSVAFDETNYVVYTTDADNAPTTPLRVTSFPLSKSTKRPIDAPIVATTAPATTTTTAEAINITWDQATDPQFENKKVIMTGPCIGTYQGHDPSLVLGTTLPDPATLKANLGPGCFLAGLSNAKTWPNLAALDKYVGKNVAITGLLSKNAYTGDLELSIRDEKLLAILPGVVQVPTPTAPAATTTIAPTTTTAVTTPVAAGTTITWEQALLPENLKKTKTVTGPVVAAVQDWGTHIKVYLGAPKPDGFVVEIFEPSKFPDPTLQSWVGKTLVVTGRIQIDDHNPEEGYVMSVSDATQVVSIK